MLPAKVLKCLKFHFECVDTSHINNSLLAVYSTFEGTYEGTKVPGTGTKVVVPKVPGTAIYCTILVCYGTSKVTDKSYLPLGT